jgi:hypothetical protein
VIYRDNLEKEKVSKFTFNGNQYLRISVHPYIQLDIQQQYEKKAKASVSIDRFSLFRFIQRSKDLLEGFKRRDLYLYNEENKLLINKRLANEISMTIPLSFNKTVWLVPTIVKDTDTQVESEGVALCINVTANYVLLTYEEFFYLISYLEHLDIEALALHLIEFAELTEDKTFTDIDKLSGIERIPDKEPEEPADIIKGNPLPPSGAVIPDI